MAAKKQARKQNSLGKRKAELSGTQTERAYRLLKTAILRGELAEGAFISEQELLQRYGISRTPLREACNRLHHEELLEVVPRRGYFITELTFVKVRDTFEARIYLEGMAGQIAAERAHPTQLAEMGEILQKAQMLVGSPNADEVLIKMNTEFHVCLSRMTQNEELVRIITAMLEKTERLSYIEHRCRRYQPSDFEKNHRVIFEALKRQDANAVRESVVADITEAQAAVLGHDLQGVLSGRIDNVVSGVRTKTPSVG